MPQNSARRFIRSYATQEGIVENGLTRERKAMERKSANVSKDMNKDMRGFKERIESELKLMQKTFKMNSE